MEICHSNARLCLYGMGDAPVFIAKRRHAPSNVHLPLFAESETHNRNTHLHFDIEAGASRILNKLRRNRKHSVSFLPSTEIGPHLIDADASRFSRSEMIAFGRISNLCLLFEFLTKCMSDG
jgi:hypothetical protein